MLKLTIAALCAAVSVGIAGAGVSTSAHAQGSGCFAQFNQAFANFTQNNPMNSSWGIRDTFQYSYFVGDQGLNILMGYQSCMEPGDFATNFQALSDMRDKGRDGCNSTSNGTPCTPTYPR
jgi:hypothetical protein